MEEGREPTRPLLFKSIPVITPLEQVRPVHTLPTVHLPDTVPQVDHPVRPVLVMIFVELRKSHKKASSTLPYVVTCIESFRSAGMMMVANDDGAELGSSHVPYTSNKRWSPALATSNMESKVSHARPTG
jgi:hypothetical protein